MNRQRYMAELSKLLSFMFKEDRTEILQHYNELLDNAEDEDALLEEFGSPTKLAVTISRTYDREERKLSVKADSKEDVVADKTSEAEFTRPAETEFKTIKAVAPESSDSPVGDATAPSGYSGSYADIVEEIRREVAAEKGEEYIPIFYEEIEPEKSEKELPDERAEEVPPEEEAEEPVEEVTAENSEEPEETEADEEAEVEANEGSDSDSEKEPEEAPETEERESAEESEEETDVELISEDAEEESAESEEKIAETPVEEVAEVEEPLSKDEEAALVLKPALLILYLIFAVPIGLVLLVITAAVTLAVLGCAAAVVGAGVLCVTFALSGIAVTADIILIIGAAIIAFALGLLLLWTGFWLILAGFSKLVDSIIKLGKKICMKEAE